MGFDSGLDHSSSRSVESALVALLPIVGDVKKAVDLNSEKVNMAAQLESTRPDPIC